MEHVLSATLELKDKFSTNIKNAQKNLNGFATSIDKNGNKIEGLGSKLKGLGEKFGGLSKGIMAGVAAFGVIKGVMAGYDFIKDAYTSYAKLDAAITRNRGIMRASVEDTAKLKTQVLELGKTMPFTAQEVAEAQYYQAMAGMKTNEVLKMTPKLLKMSIASGQDLASTSDILTDSITAFGLKLQDADRLMDVMTATANNSNTNIAMLGEAYKYVAATSKSFDSMEEVNIILGTLANNSLKGSIAGRNLAAIYARLSKTTPDMDKALKKVGISLYDNNKKFKGLRKIIEEMKPALAKMNDEQKNYILTTIAGTEGLKVLTALLGTTKESYDNLNNSIYNSKGANEEFYNLQKNTPENKIKALASAWDNLKLHIGDASAPAITSLIENLTNKVLKLTDSDTFSKENVQAFFDVLIQNLNTTLDILSAIATLLKPIIWGLKLVNKTSEVGKNIGSYLTTGKSYQQNLIEKEIINTENKISQINPQTLEEEEKRKKLFIQNEKLKQEYWNEYGKTIETRAKAGNPHAKENLIFKPISNDSEEVASIYEERYRYRKSKELQDNNKNKVLDSVVARYPVSDVIGKKPVISPPQQTITNNNITPQINLNMGGVTINNEMDKKKMYEDVVKQLDKAISEASTYRETTK